MINFVYGKQWKIYEKECQSSKQRNRFFKIHQRIFLITLEIDQLILLIKSLTKIMPLFMKLS